MIQEQAEAEIEKYLEKMKDIQKAILNFIEKENTIKDDYKIIIKYLDDNEIQEDYHDFNAILRMIIHISNHHHRTPNFFNKIEHILSSLKGGIEKFYTKNQIFDIFQSNKRLLLYLFEEKILIPDESLASIITTDKYVYSYYPEYFYPEFKAFFNDEKCQEIESKTHKFWKNAEFAEKNPKLFDQKRKNAENSENICQLIRDDMIDQFILYVNRQKKSFSDTIETSIFETNSFLMNKKPTFIEYSALFGSVLIFKFLILNEIQMTPNLWLFAIHGENTELIEQLEQSRILPKDKSYKECLLESIKCHHIKLSKYIEKKLFKNEKDVKIYEQSFKFYNYEYFPDDLNNQLYIFFDMCKFNYYKIVKCLLAITKLDLNMKRIQNKKIFF